MMTVPTLIVLWNADRSILAFGQEPGTRPARRLVPEGYMW